MTISDIDYDIRKFNSVLLRVVILSVLFCIYLHNDNYFGPSTYLLATIFYVLLLILNVFNKAKGYKGTCRLILDLLVIGVFLYGKNLSNVLNFLPFILLLSNVNSHSNKNSKILIFSILLHLDILIIDDFRIVKTHHLIPLIYYAFILITFIRQSFNKVNEGIILTIGDLFINNVNENNSHQILAKVKKLINKGGLGRVLKINEIFLFVNYNQRLILIKGSKFVKNNILNFSFETEELIKKFAKKNLQIQKEDFVEIDNIKYNNIYWIKHSINETDYFFLICLEDDSYIFRELIIQKIRPVFEYIGRLYYLRSSLTKLNNDTSKIIKEKITYVLDAQNALHFVKNKLSPITTTVGLMDKYFKRQSELNPVHKTHIEKRLRENNNNNQLRLILNKAEVLIKGVDNIINQEDKEVSVKQIIDDLRNNWLYHFENIDDIVVEIEDLNIRVNYNQMLFDFVFTDIIENINKYSHNQMKKVIFTLENDIIIIRFNNLILDYEKNKLNLKEIESLYNQENNDEIYNRKTHGLSFIRRLLRRKKITNEISIDKSEKTFNFKITLKTLKDEENTSI
ncbi:MAG: hypothetical protein ABI426_02860 [Flavobacterium sp.]